jgi:hypothetical protein
MEEHEQFSKWRSGVNVKITIFGSSDHFSANKIAILLKNDFTIVYVHTLLQFAPRWTLFLGKIVTMSCCIDPGIF